jgi:hypothetical protein
MPYHLAMSITSLPYAIGTLTNKGTFLGMSEALPKLGRFSQNIGERAVNTLCNPKLAKPITQEEENEHLVKQSKSRGFFTGAQVFEGNNAFEILRALAGKA